MVQKSCTTKDDDYPIIYRVLTIPGGAGFRPSTVCLKNSFQRMSINLVGFDPQKTQVFWKNDTEVSSVSMKPEESHLIHHLKIMMSF